MKIIQPYARIISEDGLPFNGKDLLRKIEALGRISHRTEEAQTLDSFDRFIRTHVLGHGDWSIVEHANVTVEMVVDRGVQQELTRHRLASYTIESTRFVNYEKRMKPSFIYPQVGIICPICEDGDEPTINDGENWKHGEDLCIYRPSWLNAIDSCESEYMSLIKNDGWRPQEARSVFPLALSSKIAITCNLRNWRHLFIMRTTTETHPQFRQVFIPLLQEFQDNIPILFEDIQPLSRQIDNLRKPR